ncbi:MAG: glycosyltransferase [Lachnospiraceae bacterium]|nr:glycosyltransferase [Lachnospiraceae bacterium]
MMEDKPKVSIITICLNSEKTIKDTLLSVLGQTYEQIEYLIIDGKSTDGTLNIINDFVPLFNGRLKIISEKDTGIYNAMNKGIRKASGEIIGIINSDDFYEPDAVRSAVNVLDTSKCQIAYGPMRYIKKNRPDWISDFHHDKLPFVMISHPACFVTRKAYGLNGLFDEKYRIAADYDLMLRNYLNKSEFIKIEKLMANHRLGGISSNEMVFNEHYKIRLKNKTISLKDYLLFRLLGIV